MSQTIDDRGRTAARDLHSAVNAVDTEAALGAMPRRSVRPWVRPALSAAAVILLAGAVAVGLGAIDRSEPTESLDAAAPPADVPIDPDTYGPVLDSITGAESPTLRADLHGPTSLHDGDQVAVAIEGGRPGMRYLVIQCTMTHDPATGPDPCNRPGTSVVLDSEGRSTAVLPAQSVFNTSPLEQSRQDCRPERCRLTVHPVYDDMNESPSRDVDKFPDQFLDEGSSASGPVTAPPASSLVLRFAKLSPVAALNACLSEAGIDVQAKATTGDNEATGIELPEIPPEKRDAADACLSSSSGGSLSGSSPPPDVAESANRAGQAEMVDCMAEEGITMTITDDPDLQFSPGGGYSSTYAPGDRQRPDFVSIYDRCTVKADVVYKKVVQDAGS